MDVKASYEDSYRLQALADLATLNGEDFDAIDTLMSLHEATRTQDIDESPNPGAAQSSVAPKSRPKHSSGTALRRSTRIQKLQKQYGERTKKEFLKTALSKN